MLYGAVHFAGSGAANASAAISDFDARHSSALPSIAPLYTRSRRSLMKSFHTLSVVTTATHG